MIARRLLLALGGFLLAAPCLAASLSERSMFAQGHWWNPERSGNGFDIFDASGQVAITWYTFDESGRPVWYTALGAKETLGKQEWPLQQQTWSNGRKGAPIAVGTVKLSVNHAESMSLAWEIGGNRGTWKIQPLIVSGIVAEVDHGGSWFDPAQSGWGFGLTEQGSALGGVLFTYDSAGRATWVSGFETGGGRSVEFYASTGSCPSCTYRPNVLTSMGRVTFDFASETRAALRSQVRLGMAPGIAVDGAGITMFSRPASSRPADRQLATFDVDAPMKAYLGDGLANVTYSQAVVVPSSPPVAIGSTTFSMTNLQESGVDEADAVKSDGRYIYAYDYSSAGFIQQSLRLARADDDGAAVQVLGTVPLWAGTTISMNSAGMYLHGERLASVTGSLPFVYSPLPFAIGSVMWVGGESRVEILTTAVPGVPVALWRAHFDGYVVSSRRIGDRLYVVTRFTPIVPGYLNSVSPAALEANRQLIAATPVDDLLPKVRINGGAATRFLKASDVHSPPQGARVPLATMTVVTSIDLVTPRIVQSLAIAGPVETIYVSSDHLFFASSRYDYRDAYGALLPRESSTYITDIHQVRLGAQAMSVVGSGSIEGYLGADADKSSFRMSEHQGRFRAITNNGQWGESVNRLTIMEPSSITPGLLRTVSTLPNAKRGEVLGKPFEQLYGTRFVGDRLYAVTFRKIDPLYVVDLSDSTDPRIAAALELPGFSDYLHPLANGLLLGFGKDARIATGVGDGQFAWYQGLQLSLYDVADATKPREMQRVLLGKRGSDSALLRDHHAFSALMNSDGSGVVAFPARLNDGAVPESGSGDSAYYPWKESGLMRFELRGTGPSNAALVQLPSLITHSSSSAVLPTYYTDPAYENGRSIIMRNGTIYSGKGKLWRQDAAGKVFGPF